jgi:hypothetical protein
VCVATRIASSSGRVYRLPSLLLMLAFQTASQVLSLSQGRVEGAHHDAPIL